ncbi:MAG: bacteriohopanetetrol glucosamine biosynthesis glycosyltransferase HpnI [Blastocatellia bacterium]|nr:bacteriohopanetetrol glucosamine biosynthesis glycosyltransferase HpnI [Blastocatellia bacterium]
MINVALGLVAIGGLVYYLLIILAVGQARRKKKDDSSVEAFPPISLLKPLKGVESGLRGYLETFFRQDYPKYEIVFAVHDENDPAIPLVDELIDQYRDVEAKLIITDKPRYSNAKVYSLERLADVAAHEILVITDSDTSVGRDYLRAIAREFRSDSVGAVTNLYRGVGNRDFWSKLEALGMSTEFMGGVVVANMLGGMDFMLGPSMAIRRQCLKRIGGFAAIAEYLADDFVLGNWIAKCGFKVSLSRYVINHHATSLGFLYSFYHRLRWNRSTRFSRPFGYIGQGFTYGVVWAAVWFGLFISDGSAELLIAMLFARLAVAIVLGYLLLKDEDVIYRLWMIPFQDMLSFASWIGGFLGKEIVWRDCRYKILPGGRFVKVETKEIQG